MNEKDLCEQLNALKLDVDCGDDATRSSHTHHLARPQPGDEDRPATSSGDAEFFSTNVSNASTLTRGRFSQHQGNHLQHARIHCSETDLELGHLFRDEYHKVRNISSLENAAPPSAAIPPKLVGLSNDGIRQQLIDLGAAPGPVTLQTREVYLRQLQRLLRNPISIPSQLKPSSVVSRELEDLCANFDQVIEVYRGLESQMEESFKSPDRQSREVPRKTSFTYLLLDPGITLNLPNRTTGLSLLEQMETFVKAIFYVGKGTGLRHLHHLNEASRQVAKESPVREKIERILRIWNHGHGVIVLRVFRNVISNEALTREAAMIETFRDENCLKRSKFKFLTNAKGGSFYGETQQWTTEQRKRLGAYLVYRALEVFLEEGEHRYQRTLLSAPFVKETIMEETKNVWYKNIKYYDTKHR